MKVIIFLFGEMLLFSKRDRQHSQNFNNDTFYRPPVTSAQCTEKYLDSGILLDYDDDDDYSRGCGQIEEAFKALTKDHIHQPSKSDNDFRSTNNRDDIG